MVDHAPEIGFRACDPESSEKMGARQVEQGFFSFFAAFLVYLINFFNVLQYAIGVLHFEESSNMPKNAE